MTSVRNIREKLASLKKLNNANYNYFLEQSSGRGRNRWHSRYKKEIANTEKQLKNALGPRKGLALEVNKARNNLAKLKSAAVINKIKLNTAPEFYRAEYHGSYYAPPTAVRSYGFNSIPKNKKQNIEKKLKTALNAHNKKIANATARVEAIEKRAHRRAAFLLKRTPGMIRRLHAPLTGMVYARTANEWPVPPNLPKTASELATMLRSAERRGERRARGSPSPNSPGGKSRKT